MTRPVDDAVAAVRMRGLRLSAARRLVLEALAAADGPMSAEQVAAGVGGRVPPSDLGSVYRNLNTLEQAGVVHHVHLGHGPGVWTLGDPRSCAYLTCERCGDFRALPAGELDAVRAHIRHRFGYTPAFDHFPVVGRCAACSNAPDRGAD